MSLLMRVNRFGSAARLIRFTDLSTTIGLDQNRTLAWRNTTRPLVTHFEVDARHFVRAETPGLLLDSTELPVGELHALHKHNVLEVLDYELVLVPVSTHAEIAASIAQGISEEIVRALDDPNLPTLSFAIAGLRKSMPLFPNVELVLGSGSSCHIKIALPGVSEKHCALLFDGASVFLAKLEGRVLWDSLEVAEQHMAVHDGCILLPEAGLSIALAFHRP